MGEVKQINIKNRTYYFYNDIINFKDFDVKLLKIDNDYGKDYTKIKCNSDDNLPLNKLLKFRLMTIIIRCVFCEDSKIYPKIF